jgi:signal transduction histidine kinase
MNDKSAYPLCILVLTPTGNDALNATSVLKEAGLEAEICASLVEVCHKISEGAGALLIAEEAFTPGATESLMRLLAAQPPWSDLPLVLITAGENMTLSGLSNLKIVGEAGNVTLVERPLRPSTLVSSLQVALRARRRQYQMRDLLATLQESKQELERRVEERTARLKETISELEAFSYSVSHDLRTPLRAMQGYSEFLWEDYSAQLDETAREYLRRILQASGRLDRLVQDILTYSRATRGELEIKDITLESLLRDVVESYPILQPSNVDIQTRQPLLHVRGHDGSLTQVFSNLLINAVKFVPTGRKPRIKIWTESHNGMVRIWFADNGIGIAPEHQERIFKMFEKAPTGHQYEGTGIGLAIVRKAVERMGGYVGVESREGRGSKFWIELPKAA